MRFSKLLVAGVLCSISAPSLSQGGDAYQPLFPQIFPKPSGKNGVEEWTLAADKLAVSAAFRAAIEPTATLTVKRRALVDPNIAEALRLFRAGIQKPLNFSSGDESAVEAAIRTFGGMRNLARILTVEQYVMLADGRVDRAMEILTEGLKMGYTIQQGAVLGGLVGIATDSLMIRGLGSHLGQLSARDCDRLVLLVQQWMALEDPALISMEREKRIALRALSKIFGMPAAGVVGQAEDKDDGGLNPSQKALFQAIETQLKGNPNGAKQLGEEAIAEAGAFYDRFAAEFKKPAWERSVPKSQTATTLGGKLFQEGFEQLTSGPLAQTLTSWQRGLAQVQLLGVHAGIRRYKWENNRLPESLEVLKLGNMALDPFNGKPFLYRQEGEGYVLSSIGAPKPNGAPGERTPLKID